MKPFGNIDEILQRARRAQQGERIREAEQLFRQALTLKPRDADVIQELAILLIQSGQKTAAVAEFERAVAIDPASASACNNLGNALLSTGQFDLAIEVLRKAIVRHPRVPQLAYNLGVALASSGNPDEAIAEFEQALTLRPDYPEALNNLAAALMSKGDLPRAISTYRKLLTIAPNFAAGHNNLGEALRNTAKFDEAIAEYRRAVELDPQLADAHYNLGIALRTIGKVREAIESYRKALGVRPDYPEALNNLGNALCDQNDPDGAVEACNKAIHLRPNFAPAFNNLGNALRQLGRLAESEDCYRRAMALAPADTEYHGNLVFSLHYSHDDPAAILAEAKRWSQLHAAPLKALARPHDNDRHPERVLRVGYVSADFRDHPVGRNLLPLITGHDRLSIQAYCYSNSPRVDSVTQKVSAAAVAWRNIQLMDDETAERTIRADKIDILVDLAGQSAGNRLPLFARKPAPIQVTFGGYPGGTGLETIDWRLSDPYLDPAGRTDSHYAEKVHRLPHSFWCYDPKSMDVLDGPDVGPLPAISSGA